MFIYKKEDIQCETTKEPVFENPIIQERFKNFVRCENYRRKHTYFYYRFVSYADGSGAPAGLRIKWLSEYDVSERRKAGAIWEKMPIAKGHVTPEEIEEMKKSIRRRKV